MDWGFIWMMFILKIPLLALLGIIWWAIRSTPEPADADESSPIWWVPRPRPRGPRPPRRGPHGGLALPPPPRSRVRTRPVLARHR